MTHQYQPRRGGQSRRTRRTTRHGDRPLFLPRPSSSNSRCGVPHVEKKEYAMYVYHCVQSFTLSQTRQGVGSRRERSRSPCVHLFVSICSFYFLSGSLNLMLRSPFSFLLLCSCVCSFVICPVSFVHVFPLTLLLLFLFSILCFFLVPFFLFLFHCFFVSFLAS